MFLPLSFMPRLVTRKRNDNSFSEYFGETQQTRKQRLLEECKKYDVSINIDDLSENSSGIYAELRGVVSEFELERRLNEKKSIVHLERANNVAILALFVSVIALVNSFT